MESVSLIFWVILTCSEVNVKTNALAQQQNSFATNEIEFKQQTESESAFPLQSNLIISSINTRF